MSGNKSSNSGKTVIYWVAVVAVLAFLLFYMRTWQDELASKQRILDACIRSAAVLFLASAVSKIAGFLFSRLGGRSNRAKTVNRLLTSVIKYAIGIASIVLVITFFVKDTSSLFTGLSMLTLVVGLGAQSLISDIVAGIFIVFEGSYEVGDVVVIDGWRGVVQEIGIRTTKIEDAGGNVQIINNSAISKIINNSTNLSLAVCDIGIEYGESIERVETVIKNNLDYIKGRIPAIIEGPFYKGVDALGDSAVVLKILAKCREDDKFQTQRDLNREIKLLFDKNHIGIPFPQVTISQLVESSSGPTAREKREAENFVDQQKALSKGVEEHN